MRYVSDTSINPPINGILQITDKMEIRNIRVQDISPNTGQLEGLPKNPRFIRDERFDALRKSIEDAPEMLSLRELLVFPHKGKYVAIGGNMRLRACRDIGYAELPCKVLDPGTPVDKLREYAIKDNESFGQYDFGALVDEWDTDELQRWGVELQGFGDENLPIKFDTDSPEKKIPGEEEKKNERTRTDEKYNITLFDRDDCEGAFDMPRLYRELIIPKSVIGFNYVKTAEEKSVGVHFFLDDYQFERVWADPVAYCDTLSEFDCVFTPDFSLYDDMPEAMKVWNVYRSRLVGQVMQRFGMHVIPTVSWSGERSFSYCFDGIEKGGVVAVSTIGTKNARPVWENGFAEMVRRLEPAKVLLYGSDTYNDYAKEVAAESEIYFYKQNFENRRINGERII